MANNKSIRILLDTTDLCLESFKCVWINVSLFELRTISDLKNEVSRKINVEGDFNLYVKGGLLLDEETITVLRENDKVQLKYKTPNPAKESRKRNFDKSIENDEIHSKKQRLEISNLSSDENENIFVKKKSQKKKRKKEESPINSENFLTPVEKRKEQKESPMSSGNICSVSIENKSPSGKSNVRGEDVNSKKHETGIVAISSNENVDKYFEKKSEKVKKKKEKNISNNSEDLYSNSLEEKRKQKMFINSKSISCISIEERNEQAESSVTHHENSYSTLIEENKSSEKRHKKKDKKKSPIAHGSAVTVLDAECSSKNIVSVYTVSNLDNECSSQKQKSNKASRTVLFDSKKVSMTVSVGDSSKSQSKNCQSLSSTLVSDINSEEVNNNQLKTKRKRRRRKRKTNTSMGSCDNIENCDLINNEKSSFENIDENINRKHIFYVSLAKNQESNSFNSVNESLNSSTDKFIVKDQSLDYPKIKSAKNQESNCYNNVSEFSISSINKFTFKNQSLDYPKIKPVENQKNICFNSVNKSPNSTDKSIFKNQSLDYSKFKTAKYQESNCFSNVKEFPKFFTDTFILKDQSLDFPKMSTPSQSKLGSIPNLQLSILASKKSNSSCSENDSTLHEKSISESIILQSDKEKHLYENFPTITKLPVVGTHIAYKTLELDENYSPIASDYREGVVEKIDPDTEELEIRLDNEIILPARNGKFENLGKDEVPEPTVKTFDVLKWCDLIEPKLLDSIPE